MSQITKSNFTKVLLVSTALIAVAACSSDNTATTEAPVTPPPVVVVTPPATQDTLASVAVGTNLAMAAHAGVESFTFSNGAQAAAEARTSKPSPKHAHGEAAAGG